MVHNDRQLSMNCGHFGLQWPVVLVNLAFQAEAIPAIITALPDTDTAFVGCFYGLARVVVSSLGNCISVYMVVARIMHHGPQKYVTYGTKLLKRLYKAIILHTLGIQVYLRSGLLDFWG